LISSILHKESESLIKIRPALAPELDHVVFQALSKKRADRYQTMEEFREDLAAIAEGLKPLKAKAGPAAVKLAVLPFSNLTGDPDQEYLSDGLTQEMVTLLGACIPRASASSPGHQSCDTKRPTRPSTRSAPTTTSGAPSTCGS